MGGDLKAFADFWGFEPRLCRAPRRRRSYLVDYEAAKRWIRQAPSLAPSRKQPVLYWSLHCRAFEMVRYPTSERVGEDFFGKMVCLNIIHGKHSFREESEKVSHVPAVLDDPCGCP